mmetsp:Transcript_27844/g.26676  ORF Transcript_27844/g.26676 Transcript_27844/m.26676 type:complete len:528 (-) Transcript_27844:358-1941(-)
MRCSEKENYSSTSSRFMKRMQQPARGYALVVGVLLVIGCIILYVGKITSSHLNKDRAGNYDVKVFSGISSDIVLSQMSKDSFSYVAMIDAGSSGCRAHVYRYGKLNSIEGPLYMLPQHDSKKVKPGLSSFAKKPTEAGASLQGLVDFIKTQVPEAQWVNTPIWLKATAGMRLIPETESVAVLESVREFLGNKKNSPFLFRQSWARIISGNEEGGFGWIAFNYLKKIIGPKKISGESPYAVVEMGGASSQVSQLAPSQKEADEIPSKYRFSFTIEGETFNLYTHSYLGYGAEQAREALNKNLLTESAITSKKVSDPCLYSGYKREASTARKEVFEGPVGAIDITGSSNTPKACYTAVQPLFATKKECPKSSLLPLSFGCVYQPAFVTESKNFLVFENFFYTSSALGVVSASTPVVETKKSDSKDAVISAYPLLTNPKNFAAAATKICNTDWKTVQETYPLDTSPKDQMVKMCFSASYANAFLIDGLHMKEDKVLTVQKEVDGSEIEWALGAAYKEAADFLKRTNLRPT